MLGPLAACAGRDAKEPRGLRNASVIRPWGKPGRPKRAIFDGASKIGHGEALQDRSKIEKDLFEAEQPNISKNLQSLDDYLRQVLSEYENEPTKRGDQVHVADKGRLAEFIRSRKDSSIDEQLLGPAAAVRRSVVELIEKNTPTGS